MMPTFKSSLLLLACAALPLVAWSATDAAPTTTPIPVKVVVVTMFEVGADTGDAPGELQYWVERDHLDQIYPLPAAYHAARMNKEGELAICTGQGTAHATATIMALGLDPRFDLTHAYWIIAGIAGGNPERTSLGSAFWARWIVDGDLGYEVDAREIPADWSTGFIPLRKSVPYEKPLSPQDDQIFAVNPQLTDWAFQLTEKTPLADNDKLRAARKAFDGAASQRPPFVGIGDEISSSTFWHGKLLDRWASDWTSYFTEGKGVFYTTAMEDTGTLLSLRSLAKAGRVDDRRVLVLRSVSNYDQQPRGLSATESLSSQRIGQYSGFVPALESAYTVGHVVVNELLTHWPKYEQTVAGTNQNEPAKP